MREIKFRAWLYQEQEMKNSIDNEKMFIFAVNGLNIKTMDDQLYYPRVSFMQYTGLKDKNGTEIYEGDILLCDDSNEDHEEFKTEVWFGNGQFLTRHYGYPVHSWCSKKESWCEIIGNIYENPELLK
jgi:uncharacterized phage protein (TIGR01671 family)